VRVVVLGMHKSGTTLVAQALHRSGISMGEFREGLDYDAGNKYEHHAFQAINRALLAPYLVPPLGHVLRRRGGSETDAAGYPRNQDSQAWIRRRALEAGLAHATVPEAAVTLVEGLEARGEDWGFKDPRTALTYPVWRRILPPHRIVVVFRGLGQVLERYRAGPRRPLRTLRVLQAWTVYNWSILRHVEESACPVLMLRYERLMSDASALDALASFVERPIEDVRDPRQHRSRASGTSLPSWVQPLVASLPVHPARLEARLHALEAV
jgi:hypothetical protein